MRIITLAMSLAMSVAGLCSIVWAAEEPKTSERLADAAALFHEVMSTPDKAIPQDLLNKSHCIILVPGLKKGGFVIAAKFGRGFAVCRAARVGVRLERCA
jgi:lipid-binding SYLF domain-containing protein